MFHWESQGRIFNPLNTSGKYWMNEFAQAPATLLFKNFVRVYFSTRSKRDDKGQFVSYSAYVDLNKENLSEIIRVAENPIIELGGRGCFDEFGIYPVSVIRNKSKIWAYYAGWTRCVSVPFNTAIGVAISKDGGKKFTKLGKGPVLSYSLNEPFLISGPKIRRFSNSFYLFYIAGKKWEFIAGKPEMLLKIRMAKSQDGISWVKFNKNLISGVNKDNESQASPDVFYKNGKYHMFFCNWDIKTFRKTKSRKIGYAYSYDLENWTREDEKVVLTASPDGFDNEMQAYPHVFEVDGSIYMMYLGNEVGRYGFGIAKLNGILD